MGIVCLVQHEDAVGGRVQRESKFRVSRLRELQVGGINLPDRHLRRNDQASRWFGQSAVWGIRCCDVGARWDWNRFTRGRGNSRALDGSEPVAVRGNDRQAEE